MHRPLFLALALALLASLALAGAPLAAEERTTPARLHLRRAVFDPLEKAPAASALGAAPGLALVQLSAPPADTTRAALAAAGLRPLWYIPDNAFLVRMPEGAAPRAKGLPGLRWLGTFDITYKYPAELDALVASNARHAVELQIVAAPDADPTALARELVGRGGTLLDRASGLNGAVLRVVLPAAALRDVVKRGDVLWVEPYRAPQALADRARGILGVPAAQTELGLTGAGQIIALTDTGLDTQEALSADFAGRVARGFSRQEMYGWCEFLSAAQQPGTWSDLHGHGTHVAGMAAGSGALSGGQLAGVAPAARLVVQAVSSGGRTLDCLPAAATYLQLAYDAGARVHNGSFGRVTGTGSCEYGCYTAEDATVDDFLWRHPDYLFVVAAGNSGRDASAPFGVVDPDSINSPATAKNVLTVGASENDRAGLGGCDSGVPERACWQVYGFGAQPLFDDLISDNPAGIAAFSSRGPTDDGRIKPEIVAPGTNIVSTRSHEPAASYAHPVGQDYAYLSGTSMATPQVSGLAALARQWLAQRRL
ncbi:MAG TPA: S8 family serine peptidase, partial [Roseiflexaceae bacterium]|nr:S8 family serine peptidase [Roseiflexaceae bacterium]